MNRGFKIARGKSIHVLIGAIIGAFAYSLIVSRLVVYAAPTKIEPARPLLEVLKKASLSGSMEVHGQCESGNLPRIPNIIRVTSDGQNVLETVRKMFADDQEMRITQDQDGTIRMRELGVQDGILRVKIRNFKFDGHSPNGGVYAPNVAVLRIMVSPEVVSFNRSNKIKWIAPSYVAPSDLGPPSPEFPHVSGSMQNVAVSEILDRVLKTFPGIWIYESCRAHNDKGMAVYFRFVTFTELLSVHDE